MGRKPRIHVPGGFYHVILRGNARQMIFRRDSDRASFCSLVETGIDRFEHRVHAFCLMGNHLHIVIQVGEIGLSKILHNLASRYSRWMNKKYKRCGHVFQDRYKAALVEVDSYLLELVRYVHVNPVRAGMVSDPADFKWSSHRDYLGRRRFPWVTTDFVLGMLASSVGVASRRYRDFISATHTSSNFRKILTEGPVDDRVLGDDSFTTAVLKRAKESLRRPVGFDAVVQRVCRAYGVSTNDIASRSQSRKLSEIRALLALLAQETGAISLSELGKQLGRDVSTLSRGARQLEVRARANREVAARLERGRRVAAEDTNMQTWHRR